MNSEKSQITNDDLLLVLEAAFRAGLLEIKRIRAAHEPIEPPVRPSLKRKDAPLSRTQNAIDVLTQSLRPLTIYEIIEALEGRGLSTTRDSLVSALTKQIAPVGPVVRVAPNTFTIKGR